MATCSFFGGMEKVRPKKRVSRCSSSLVKSGHVRSDLAPNIGDTENLHQKRRVNRRGLACNGPEDLVAKHEFRAPLANQGSYADEPRDVDAANQELPWLRLKVWTRLEVFGQWVVLQLWPTAAGSLKRS